MSRAAVLLLAAVVTAGGCAVQPAENSAAGAQVGAITAEGDVTTVINESGSVWGGAAELVEEASIGLESGAEEYLLGRVAGVAADDERIYLLDAQVPALRVYDLDGAHLFDIAPIGQGPGEFRQPDGFVLSPSGTLHVTDFSNGRRLVSFDRDGTALSTMTVQRMPQSAPLRAGADGVVTVQLDGEIGDVSPDGVVSARRPLPETDMTPWTVRTAATENYSGGTFYVPKAPRAVWAVLPSGALAVADSADYRITVDDPAGGRLIIERHAEAVRIEGSERQWLEQYFARRLAIGSGIVEGDIPPIPDAKPYLSWLIGAHDGSLWVHRPGPGREVPDCADFSNPLEMMTNPCWVDETIIEVFSADGRYLGQVDAPPGFKTRPPPFIRGDRVVAVVENDAGTIMVKRYRLVLPGEEGR